MDILVTGASGFVGKALITLLQAAGHRVLALARGTAPLSIETISCDLGRQRPKLPAGLDAVIHLAQARSYRDFPADAQELFKVNVVGTQHLLEAASEAGIGHFCLISSGSVYEPFRGPLHEDMALAPRSYLAASKLAAEMLARPFADLLTVSVLRLFMPYGPGQTQRLVPDLIDRIANGEPVTLPLQGDGMQFAPSYVDDVCDVIATCVRQNWSGTYNVASPEAITIAQAAVAIGRRLSSPVWIDRRPIDAPRIVPELDRLAARYDLSRFRPFHQGLSETIATARTQQAQPDAA